MAQVIRDRFFLGYREAEFIVVCDVKKENSQVIKELNDAQVSVNNCFFNILNILLQIWQIERKTLIFNKT